jgi:hypothetical protein
MRSKSHSAKLAAEQPNVNKRPPPVTHVKQTSERENLRVMREAEQNDGGEREGGAKQDDCGSNGDSEVFDPDRQVEAVEQSTISNQINLNVQAEMIGTVNR